MWKQIREFFTREYELTITFPPQGVQQGKIITKRLSRIDRLTSTHAKGIDTEGMWWELKTKTEFDYEIQRKH